MPIVFKNISPIPELQNFIEKIWVFESSGNIPAEDIKLVVPNGRMRLLIPYRNAITSTISGNIFHSKEHMISLTGVVDVPSRPDLPPDTGTIGIEFSPIGCYRFFALNLSQINNKIFPVEDLLGSAGKQLQEQVSHAKTTELKLALVQQFLFRQIAAQKEDAIFEYCIKKIKDSRGTITIKELEKKTGYSSRWLNMKFSDKLGISPKNLASIIRFKQYYQAWVNNKERSFLENEFYDYYYDQSHFLKDFKRFTGHSHQGFDKHSNDFGKLFYRD